MKAVIFRGIGDIALENVPDPKIKKPTDVVIRITASAICGTDLHFIRGTFPGVKEGRILGHEAVGIIEEVGKSVRNLRRGDRVVVPSTVGCGSCTYCRAGYHSQCNLANPNGPHAGTVFFGGPEAAGGLDGLQAEYACIPFAASNLVKLPDEITDDQGVLMSDILPTSYMAGPIEVLRDLTDGSGPDRVIDAVGVDAAPARRGPAFDKAVQKAFKEELEKITQQGNPSGKYFQPGGAPSQAVKWAIESVAKAGTVSVIGVYSSPLQDFPLEQILEKNLTLKPGNCNHRRYMPEMIELVRSGIIRPEQFLTQVEPINSAIDAYRAFDSHESGWIKVKLNTALQAERAA